MKKVHDLDMVAHLFANQSQTEARNGGNTFYFYKDTIYSFGSHFPIAKHTKNKKGDTALLFTTRGYSNTTSKHISITSSACRHLNKIYCSNPNKTHKENIIAYEKNIKECLLGLDRARKLERYIEPAKHILEQCIKYCDFFNLKVPKKITKLIEQAESGKYADYLAKERNRIEKEKQKEEKAKFKLFSTNLEKWRKGDGDRLYGHTTGFDYLRFNGKRIETSQGVEIPIDTAKKSFNFIMKSVKVGGVDKPEHKILNWNINKITAEFLQIGCHKIEITEINSMAKQMKWI